MPKRLMLDTNVYDLIVAKHGFAERVNRAVVAGEIEILRTRIHDEEMARIPNAAKRAAMRAIRSRLVPVSEAAWSKDGPPPSADAQIAATAAETVDVLVTEDKDLRAEAKRHVEVWRFEELVAFVGS
ncbi:MAG: hypothetical protein FJX54_12440 [Alphaproteobacteria bacterium]|nr:hypothetical protein [Alphaproteobacteria bacterium]